MRHNRRHRELATGGAQFDPHVADDPIGVEKRLASPQERAEWAEWIVTAPPALPVVTGPRLPKRMARGAFATGGVQFDPYAGRVQPGAQERWKYDPVAMRLSAGDLTEEESPMTVRFTSAAHDAMSTALCTSPYGVFGSDDAPTVAVKPVAKSSGGMVALAALGALGIGLGFYLYSKPAAAAPAAAPQPVAPPGPNSKAVVTHPATGVPTIAPVISHPDTGAPVAVVTHPATGAPMAVPVVRKPTGGGGGGGNMSSGSTWSDADQGGMTGVPGLAPTAAGADYVQAPTGNSGGSSGAPIDQSDVVPTGDSNPTPEEPAAAGTGTGAAEDAMAAAMANNPTNDGLASPGDS